MQMLVSGENVPMQEFAESGGLNQLARLQAKRERGGRGVMEVKESKPRLCECMYVYIVETACWCVNNVHQPSHISGYAFATQTQQTCTHMDATTYSSHHVPSTTTANMCSRNRSNERQ